MDARRRLRPQGEGLESRVAPVGFYQGPSPVPVLVHLVGTAAGDAVIRPAPVVLRGRHVVESGVATVKIGASGVITPLGRATISGTLRTRGADEVGTLSIRSSFTSLTLSLSGPAGATASSALEYRIVDGTTALPGTSFSSARVEGTGTVDITPAPGSGNARITLVFGP